MHLREGVGFAVDWKTFPDEAAIRAALAAGKIDLAIASSAPADLPGPGHSGAACPQEPLAQLREGLQRRWSGEVYLLPFATGADPCLRPALVVSRAVLEDLRFGILGKEAGRFAAAVTREDLVAVRTAGERGGERAAVAAARAALDAKAKR